MSTFQDILRGLVDKLSEANYDESFAQYRFWLDLGSTHGRINGRDQVNSDIDRMRQPGALKGLIHPTAHLLIRFIGDVEADQKISRHGLGLHRQRCASALYRFFGENLSHMSHMGWDQTSFLTDANLIAHWANLGYVEKTVICDHILQSLTSHPKLYSHQADALIILFKLAGATFGAYAGLPVIDRCHELLYGHYSHNSVKGELVLEVIESRETDWKGLHPPPVFTTEELSPAGTDRGDPVATPVITSLGLLSGNLGSQIPQSPPLEPFIPPENDASPESPVPRSPSISIATLSDFTVADTSDDEPPLDPAAITPHSAFYLEDGNVEVLCGNTLFRVHSSVSSFHSPVLGRILAKANLATAGSPNGCPQIRSSDAAADFTTLLKLIYLPTFPERNKVPDFTTFSSLLRMTAKYEMPAVRSQIVEVICGAYPEAFEGLAPSKSIGESVFSGPTPHPNEVLNLFIQQNLAPALPMAYYMAVRRGPDSLMNRRLPASARLSPEILQVAVKGLLALREMELKETHRLILGSKGSRPCSLSTCPSHKTTGPGVSEAHQNVIDRMTDSARSGTNLLQVLSLKEVCGGDYLGFCGRCVEGWEVGHADLRKKAWGVLPDVFGLKG